jgi:hypothetical protein
MLTVLLVILILALLGAFANLAVQPRVGLLPKRGPGILPIIVIILMLL